MSRDKFPDEGASTPDVTPAQAEITPLAPEAEAITTAPEEVVVKEAQMVVEAEDPIELPKTAADVPSPRIESLEAKPLPEVEAPAPVAEPPRRGGFVPALLGGVIAAGLGFGAAHYMPSDLLPAELRPAPRPEITDLQARLATQEGRADQTAALQAQLQAQEAEISALRAAIAQQTDASASLDALQSEMQALRDQFAALPQNQTNEEIAALKASLEAERAATEARAEALRAEAELTARSALARGAALRIQAAMDTGADFSTALADLSAAGIDVPAALAQNASGAPSLSALQDSFPDAARATLAALATPGPEAGLGERFSAFLKVQTGLRPLTPQEGNSPEAILSRAEAAVRAGDLAAALRDLDSLPAEAAAPLAPWRDKAALRLSLAQALAELAALSPAQETP